MIGVCFEISAQRKGEHWRLGQEEKTAWGEALANCIRHVPMPEKHVGIAADIAALGFVAYASIVPRINADRAVLASQQTKSVHPPERVVPFERPAHQETETMEPAVILRPPIG